MTQEPLVNKQCRICQGPRALQVVLWLGTGLPGLATAAERLDGVTVIAPAEEAGQQTGDVVEEESSVSRLVVPAERLTESANSIATVLARSAGVQSRGTGGFGSSEFLSIRAGSAQQTGVYLDGIRLNGASNPAFDFSTVDALGLASADVYRGGTPPAFGNNDIGGAVNLRSSGGDTDGNKARADLLAGSFGSVAASLGGQYVRGPWQVLASAGHREADNDFDVLDDNGTRFNTSDDEIEPRLNADASRTAILARVKYQHHANRDSSLLIQGSRRDSGVPTPRNNPDNRARFSDDALSLQATQVINRLGAWNTRQSLYLTLQDSLYDDRDGDIGLGAQRTDSDAQTTGIRLFGERLGDTGTLSLVLDVSEEDLEQQDLIRGGRDLDARRQRLSLTAHHALYLPGEAIVVTPGIGYEFIRDRVRVSEEAEALRGAPAASEQNNATPRLGLRAELAPRVHLRANASRVQRSPSFSELFGDSGLLLASPDLVGESGTNIDLALAWTTAGHSGERLASIGVFHNRRRNLISTVFDARGVGRAENISGARVDGIELELGMPVTSTLAVEANLTWQNTRQQSPFEIFDGKQIPGQARQVASARLDWRRHRWHAWYGIDHQRGRFFDTANLLPARDSTLQHAGVSWTRDTLSVSLTLDNLGDVNVEDFRGFPRPGRAAYLGLNLTL